jgi:hypothetical protein
MRFLPTAVCLVLLSASIAQACSCGTAPTTKESLKHSTAVFSGKVTKIEPFEKYYFKVTFEIDRTWKGTKGKTETVLTANSGAGCGYTFEKGKSYLLYCDRPKMDEIKPIPLYTSICSRTKSLKFAAADIKELGEGEEAQERIAGTTVRSDRIHAVRLLPAAPPLLDHNPCSIVKVAMIQVTANGR